MAEQAMMSIGTAVIDHKAQLGQAKERFKAQDDADFIRHLALGAKRLQSKIPKVAGGVLGLVAGVSVYPVPPDFSSLIGGDWGMNSPLNAWDYAYPGSPPRIRVAYSDGGRVLQLDPAPSMLQLNAWGSVYPYRYVASYSIDPCDIPDSGYELWLLAALIEATRELAADHCAIQLHKGVTGLPSAGMPSYLYERLLAEWAAR